MPRLRDELILAVVLVGAAAAKGPLIKCDSALRVLYLISVAVLFITILPRIITIP